MKKIGYRRIRENKSLHKKILCQSCGCQGEFRVTYKDQIGEVVAVLCKNCLCKEYEDLSLQYRLQFPLNDK